MTLIRPSALPDELATGYLGRVIRTNGIGDLKRGISAVLDWAGIGDESRKAAPLIQAVAQIAGVELHQFVADHTMLPLRRAVASDGSGDLLGGARQCSTLWSLAMRPTRPEHFFCPCCVVEDIGFHGLSYWRREHQIPGQYFCSKHGEALLFTQATNAAFHFPSGFVDVAVEPVAQWLNVVRDSVVIQRYLDLCAAMLQRTNPCHERHVSKAAVRRAAQLKLHTGKGFVRTRLLSDVLREQVDRHWLQAVLPTTSGFPTSQVCPPIDGVLRGKAVGYSPLSYLLAFAVMYEDSDEALRVITAEPSQDLTGSRVPRTRRTVPTEYLLSSYVRCHGNHAGVADETDLEPADVTDQLKAMGLPRLGSTRPEKLEAVVNSILVDGKSVSEACRDVGISVDGTRRALEVALAPLRSVLKRMQATEPGKIKKKGQEGRQRSQCKPKVGTHVES